VITDVYGNERTPDAAVLHVVLDLPITGDTSEPLLYALAMIASVAVLLYVCAKKRA
jgi:LPXTG-motif cell wall-anchored protein